MQINKINYRRLFNEVKLTTDHHLNFIAKNFEHLEIKNSVEVLLHFDKALKSIVNSSLFIEKNEDSHYSLCILYRTILEMHIKSFFIFLTAFKSKDKYAGLFIKSGLYELQMYYEQIKSYLSEENRNKLDDVFSGMVVKQDKETINYLKFKNILEMLNSKNKNEFLDEKLLMNDKLKDQNVFQYSKLCSYVHGGFDALSKFYNNELNDPPKEKIIQQIVYLFIINRMNVFILNIINLKLNFNIQEILAKLSEIEEKVKGF